jgi:hypothetical protein
MLGCLSAARVKTLEEHDDVARVKLARPVKIRSRLA